MRHARAFGLSAFAALAVAAAAFAQTTVTPLPDAAPVQAAPLDASALADLAKAHWGDAKAGAVKAGACAACHGLDGNPTDAQYPRLAGMPERYVAQQLVYFDIPPTTDRFLVDLPGYGYAKVPQDLQAHWQAFLDGYFGSRDALRGLVVVMDIRHPLKDYDRQMLGYAVQRGLPAHALLTKADKLGRGATANTLQAVRRELSEAFGDTVSVQAFSGESKQGVDEARAVVGRWLAL
jgi:GTP-binding protein